MIDQTDLTKVGKHDFDKEYYLRNDFSNTNSFSINIFPYGLYSNGKKLKKLGGVVRIHGSENKKSEMIKMAELVVSQLDSNEWDGRKNVFI